MRKKVVQFGTHDLFIVKFKLMCMCAFCLKRPSPKWLILCRVGL